MEINAKNATGKIHEAIKWTLFTYEQNESNILYYENEYLDLAHGLEFVEFDVEDGYEFAKQLKENRQKRRQAKEENEILRPLYEILTRHKSLLPEMDKIKGKVQQTIQTQSSRIYTPRARTDMKEAFERAKVNA